MKTIFTSKREPILVDDEDYERLSQRCWHINSCGYAVTKIKHPAKPGAHTVLAMHREILGLAHGIRTQVDHCNGLKTDNRRSNLRKCSHTENSRNKPMRANKVGLKGVRAYKSRRGVTQKFQAQICVDKKTIHLGYFLTPEQAHAAYCEAARKYHGDFANLSSRSGAL
jgi:hypothetical protein